MVSFTMKQLLDNGVHYGHKVSSGCPDMFGYIYGVCNGMHITDLRYTASLLRNALDVIKSCASKNGRILFICSRDGMTEHVAEATEKCGQYYINSRWLGGTLTNWSTISKSIRNMKNLEVEILDKAVHYTKRELMVKKGELKKLQVSFNGIKDMGGVANLICLIGADTQQIAIKEANKLDIPVVSVVDTNCSTRGINYPIPGNDDSESSIKFFLNMWSLAVIEGMQESKKHASDLGAKDNSSFNSANKNPNNRFRQKMAGGQQKQPLNSDNRASSGTASNNSLNASDGVGESKKPDLSTTIQNEVSEDHVGSVKHNDTDKEEN